MRAAVVTGLSVGRFRVGPVDLGSAWSEIDASEEDVREVLSTYVGSHIRLHPDDVADLGAYGLRMQGGRVVPIAKEPAAVSAPSAQSEPVEGEPAASTGRRRRPPP